MVQDDGRLGEPPRQVGQFGDLRVIDPGIERQTQRRQLREAFTEGRIGHHVGRRRRQRCAGGRIGVPHRRKADAAKAPATSAQMRLEHGLDLAAQQQVGVADDAGGHPARPVRAAGAEGCRAVDELGLAHRAQRGRGVLVVHGVGLDRDGGANVVAGGQVAQHVLHEVAVAGVIPQVVVGVDDRQLGLEDLLLLQGQPLGPDGKVRGGGCGDGAAHVYLGIGCAFGGRNAGLMMPDTFPVLRGGNPLHIRIVEMPIAKMH